MAARLTDLEIARLIGEEKRLPEDYLSRLELKSKKGHNATERYQTFGMEEDSYALLTDNFSDFHKAVDCLFSECGFISPSGSQMKLF